MRGKKARAIRRAKARVRALVEDDKASNEQFQEARAEVARLQRKGEPLEAK